MPNKLKEMELSSVDMCRKGANQEAFFRLFKSDNPDTNIFKRFLNWLRENPDEIPEDVIEKDYTTFDQINDNRESEDKLWRYADALTCSIRSIRDDNELSREEKANMMRQSLQQFDAAMGQLIDQLAGSAPQRNKPMMAKSADIDHIVEVEKFNPYHGKDGRFTSANGGGAVSGSGSGGGAGSDKQPTKAERENAYFSAVEDASGKTVKEMHGLKRQSKGPLDDIYNEAIDNMIRQREAELNYRGEGVYL